VAKSFRKRTKIENGFKRGVCFQSFLIKFFNKVNIFIRKIRAINSDLVRSPHFRSLGHRTFVR